MISLTNIGWAAGFLEGEGSFYYSDSSTYVVAVQKQMEPLIRLQSLFGGSISTSRRGISRWQITGPNARGLMLTVYTFLSPRRREQVRTALAAWKASPRVRIPAAWKSAA